MQSFGDIIKLWPTRQAFCDDLGLHTSSATNMIARDSISPVYWNDLILAAAERNIPGINLRLLAGLAEKKKDAKAGDPKTYGYTTTRTEDGTVIVFDPASGISVSRQSVEEALAELRRLIGGRRVAA